MMENKTKLLIIGILLVSIPLGIAALNAVSNVVFTPEPIPARVREQGLITFECAKAPMNFTVDEPNQMSVDREVERRLRYACPGKTVENIRDWEGRQFKEVTVEKFQEYEDENGDTQIETWQETYKSFDEDKLDKILSGGLSPQL